MLGNTALNFLKSRGHSYEFLSVLYGGELSADLLLKFSAQMDTGSIDEGSEGFDLLRQFLRQITKRPIDEVVTDLAAEYAALFLGVGPVPASPFESVYTSPEKLMMQEARDQVLLEYRREGLTFSKRFKEPEDHIAVEMEFMSYLCQEGAKALEIGDLEKTGGYLQKQKKFLEQHLLNWAPRFCQDLNRVARKGFYRAVGQITQEYLSSEAQNITELLGSLKSGETAELH